MSIFNYFGETLSWDIFTQGVFFSFILYLGGYLFYITQILNLEEDTKEKDSEESDKKNDKEESFIEKNWTDFKNTISKYSQNKINLKNTINIFAPFIKSFLRFKLILLPLTLILIFTLGIIIHTVSDSWIDESNYSHFGLKSYWANDLASKFKGSKDLFSHCNTEDNLDFSRFNDYADTDTGIKLISFDRIYRHHKEVCPIVKLQIYYDIKHKLLANEKWRGYLSYSQVLINLTQGIALSFFFLMLLSSLNLLFHLLRIKNPLNYILVPIVVIIYFLPEVYLIKTIQSWIVWMVIGVGAFNLFLCDKKRKILINLSFIILSMGGYLLASSSWMSNEYEVCYKTYGVYKIIDEKLDYNEIEVLYPKKTMEY